MSNVKITGLEEIQKKLSNLEKKVANKVLKNAIRNGAKLFLNETRKNAPIGKGALRKSIKIKTPRKAKKDRASIMVGTGSDFDRNFRGKTFYGAFVNWGTSKQKANPFMTLAFKSKEDSVRKTVIAEIEHGIDSALR